MMVQINTDRQTLILAVFMVHQQNLSDAERKPTARQGRSLFLPLSMHKQDQIHLQL